MKPSVNGVLTFGLVSVPVGVASATKSTGDPSFRTLHEVCKQPVSMKTVANEAAKPSSNGGSSQVWCETCNVEATETLKGFEYAKGEFVYFSESELESLKSERTPSIVLRKFVKLSELRPQMVEKHYFLIPNATVSDGYGLLFQQLAQQKVAGIGTQSLWGKEHPCAVVASRDYPDGGVLMMQTLSVFEDLVVPDFSAPIPRATSEMKAVAKQIVEELTGTLSPASDLVSATRARMLDAIQAKVDGHELSVPATEPVAETPDLMEALRASMKEIQARKEAPKSKAKAKAKK